MGGLVGDSQNPQPLNNFPHHLCQDPITLDRKVTASGCAIRAEILTDIAVLHLCQEQWTQIDRLKYPMVVQHVQKRSIAPLLCSVKIHHSPER